MKKALVIAVVILSVIATTAHPEGFAPIADEFLKRYDEIVAYANPGEPQKAPELSESTDKIQRITFGAGWFEVDKNRNKITQMYLTFYRKDDDDNKNVLSMRNAISAVSAAEDIVSNSEHEPGVVFDAFVSEIVEAMGKISFELDLLLLDGSEVMFHETDDYKYYLYNAQKLFKQLGLANPYTNIVLKAK